MPSPTVATHYSGVSHSAYTQSCTGYGKILNTEYMKQTDQEGHYTAARAGYIQHTQYKTYTKMRGNAQPAGRLLGGLEHRSYFSPFVDQSTPN